MSLTPFELIAFRVNSSRLDITAYETDPMATQELARLEGVLDRAEELLADPEVKLSLSVADRKFVEETIAEAREAIENREYALAWSLITHHRFWISWQDFLEKAAASQARLPASVGETQPNEDPPALPALMARRTNAPISVDGSLDEAAWTQAPFIVGFWSNDKKKSFAESGIKALYDDRNLYLAVVCADRDIRSVKADAEDEMGINASRDDQIAIFIQPDESKPLYYQMAFNMKGVQFDQRVSGGDRDYDYHPQWDNATQIKPKYWVTEVILPYKAFGLTGPPPCDAITKAQKQVWRINICRRVRNNLLKRSSWSWLPGDWHDASRFGYLRFQ